MREPRLRQMAFGLLAAVVASGFFVCNVAVASHIEPRKAKKYTTEAVTTYEPCLAPNDATPTIGIPACSPVVRSDSVCGFEPDIGKGRFVGRVMSSGDIKLRGMVVGLSEGCEGEVLAAAVSVRITTENCSGGGSCTTGDFQMPLGNCTVSGGSCRVSSTVNTVLPGALRPGENEAFEVLGCSLWRVSGPNAPVQTLSCGLLIK